MLSYRKQVFTVWQNRPAGSPGFVGFQRGKFRGVFGMGFGRTTLNGMHLSSPITQFVVGLKTDNNERILLSIPVTAEFL